MPTDPPLERPRLTLSASKLSLFLDCPRRYAFRHVEHRPPEFVSSALHFGKALHEALARFHLDPGVTEDELVACFERAMNEPAEAPIRFRPYESRASLLELALAMLRAYRAAPPIAAPTGVEVPFEVDLGPTPILRREGLRLCGRYDVLLAGHIVADWKTASRRPDPRDHRRTIQFTTYAWSYRAEHGVLPRIEVICLVKDPENPTVQTTWTERTEHDLVLFERTVMRIVEAIDAGRFPRAQSPRCAYCEYQGPCDAELAASRPRSGTHLRVL